MNQIEFSKLNEQEMNMTLSEYLSMFETEKKITNDISQYNLFNIGNTLYYGKLRPTIDSTRYFFNGFGVSKYSFHQYIDQLLSITLTNKNSKIVDDNDISRLINSFHKKVNDFRLHTILPEYEKLKSSKDIQLKPFRKINEENYSILESYDFKYYRNAKLKDIYKEKQDEYFKLKEIFKQNFEWNKQYINKIIVYCTPYNIIKSQFYDENFHSKCFDLSHDYFYYWEYKGVDFDFSLTAKLIDDEITCNIIKYNVSHLKDFNVKLYNDIKDIFDKAI